jgi:hypothetical protein
VPYLDPVPRGLGQHRVVQQHQVHIEQRRQLGRGFDRQIGLERGDLADDGVACMAQTGHLSRRVDGIDEVMRHINPAGRHQHGTPDGDTTRNRLAEHLDAHALTLAAPLNRRAVQTSGE